MILNDRIKANGNLRPIIRNLPNVCHWFVASDRVGVECYFDVSTCGYVLGQQWRFIYEGIFNIVYCVNEFIGILYWYLEQNKRRCFLTFILGFKYVNILFLSREYAVIEALLLYRWIKQFNLLRDFY